MEQKPFSGGEEEVDTEIERLYTIRSAEAALLTELGIDSDMVESRAQEDRDLSASEHADEMIVHALIYDKEIPFHSSMLRSGKEESLTKYLLGGKEIDPSFVQEVTSHLEKRLKDEQGNWKSSHLQFATEQGGGRTIVRVNYRP